MCNCSCLFEAIHSFVDLNVNIALRVNKVVEVVLLNSFGGKEADVDLHEFRFLEGVVFEVEVLISSVANRAPGVDMTLLKNVFIVGSEAQSVLVFSLQWRRLPPTVRRVRKGSDLWGR